MKTKIILDEAVEVVIEPYRLIEQKLRELRFDGERETNRNYIYYILIKQYDLDNEIWDNPFINYEHIQIETLMVHDRNHEMYHYMKMSSINKYEIDHAIDHLEMLVEGPGHYKLIRKTASFQSKEGTPILDFLDFFNWTQGQI